MKCQICGQRDAVTHIKRSVGHQVSEWFVCAQCAYESGLVSSYGTSFHNVFDEVLFSPFFKGPNLVHKNCPTCRTSLEDIIRSGRVGCPECYITFYDSLSPSLRRVHGDLTHVGKTPQRYRPSTESELSALKNELEEALKLQEYERCAALRDRIRELEGGAV